MDQPSRPKTWQEAFEAHKIPDIRSIEKQLRAGVSRDKEKLRVLVGGNYRDLLSTADQIITLNSETKTVESKISDISLRCQPTTSEKGTRSTAAHDSITAQLRLLSKCVLCTNTALRSRSFLSGAELSVISRLLLKSLSDSQSSVQVTDHLRLQETSLRRRLLRAIDMQLIHPVCSLDLLVEAICAYCLITSTSSSDAIKHFRSLRLNKLRERFDNIKPWSQHIQETFKYLISSIQSLQSLYGRHVNDLLTSLQRQPILGYSHIAALEVTNLDQTRSMIPQDILAFIPYIKHASSSKDETIAMVEDWSLEACQIFSKGLADGLSQIKSMDEIMLLRTGLLNIILPVYFSIQAQQSLVKVIRQTTGERLLELVQKHMRVLLQLAGELVAQSSKSPLPISAWHTVNTQKPNLSGNAFSSSQIQGRHSGTREALEKDLRRLKKWVRILNSLRNQTQVMRGARWQDIIEEAEEEDETAASALISKLSNEDPERFESSLTKMVQDAFTAFFGVLQQKSANITSDTQVKVEEVVFLIRAIRESTAILKSAVASTSTNFEGGRQLYEALAAHVVQKLSSTFAVQRPAGSHTTSLSDDLPSPLTISVLREICSIMVEVGGVDIWSPEAVKILKARLRATVFDEENMSHYIASDFDRAYLRAGLGGKNDPDSAENMSSIGPAADAYWNRTKLLFGVLG